MQEPFKYTTWSTYGIDEYALLHAVPIFTYVGESCPPVHRLWCERICRVREAGSSTACTVDRTHVDFATFGFSPFPSPSDGLPGDEVPYRGADRTMINLGGFFFLVLKTA